MKFDNQKPQLLIVDKNQFGYITDPYKWCENLRRDYNIIILTGDQGKEKIELQGIKVVYVPFRFPYIVRGILFVVMALYYIYRCNGVTMIEYFKGCSVLQRLCPHKKLIVDVRTLSVEADENSRLRYDKMLRTDCRRFAIVSAISEGVIKSINIDDIKILPLGSDVISSCEKCYTGDIRLLYVGTFINRNLEILLEGVKLFKDVCPNQKIFVDIVGDGLPGDLDKLKKMSDILGIDGIIKFHGYVPLYNIKPFFDKCNVGISFIPMVPYYDNQPPTKTFEYIRSGLFCLATATKANIEIINQSNGLIIDDTAKGVCDGLIKYVKLCKCIDEKLLRESLKRCDWKVISHEYLMPILKAAYM